MLAISADSNHDTWRKEDMASSYEWPPELQDAERARDSGTYSNLTWQLRLVNISVLWLPHESENVEKLKRHGFDHVTTYDTEELKTGKATDAAVLGFEAAVTSELLFMDAATFLAHRPFKYDGFIQFWALYH